MPRQRKFKAPRHFTVTLEEAELREARVEAKRKGLSLSEFVRLLFLRALGDKETRD